MEVRRLGPADVAVARATFAMLGEAFGEEPWTRLPEAHLTDLLTRTDLWVLAALEGAEPVGALTAHMLPMTRSASTELLIYDLAVRADRRRRGVGTALIERVRAEASAAGVESVWVPADDEDAPALELYRRAGGAAQAVTIFSWTP